MEGLSHLRGTDPGIEDYRLKGSDDSEVASLDLRKTSFVRRGHDDVQGFTKGAESFPGPRGTFPAVRVWLNAALGVQMTQGGQET